MDDLKTG